MDWLRKLIGRYRNTYHKNVVEGVKSEAQRLFQIKEYDSMLWLTYNDQLIAPFTILCEKGNDTNECVALVNAIRNMYVERVADGNKR